LRDQTRLNASGGADEEDFSGELLPQLMSDGQGGDDVSAGAAARDDDAHKMNINQGLACTS
jgi:hypothetical protein